MAGIYKLLSNEFITACDAKNQKDLVLALGAYLLENRKRKETGWEKTYFWAQLCLQSRSGLEVSERVDRGRESELGFNGFVPQLPFYILLPNKVSYNRAGTIYQHNFFFFFAKLNLSKNDSVLRGVGFSGFSSCI